MTPGGSEPTGKVAEAIQSTFSSFDAGSEMFVKAAKNAFRIRMGMACCRCKQEAADLFNVQPG